MREVDRVGQGAAVRFATTVAKCITHTLPNLAKDKHSTLWHTVCSLVVNKETGGTVAQEATLVSHLQHCIFRLILVAGSDRGK